MMVSAAVFAMDIETGKLKWLHRGDKIAHITISIGDDVMFLSECSVTEGEKRQALRDKRELIRKGILEDDHGKPKLHLHASFGRAKKTITGCVRMGVDVWRIGEVIMIELNNGKVTRVKDEETGFQFLEVGS